MRGVVIDFDKHIGAIRRSAVNFATIDRFAAFDIVMSGVQTADGARDIQRESLLTGRNIHRVEHVEDSGRAVSTSMETQ